MKTIHPRKQSGSSLVVVISVLATLMVVVGIAAEYTYTVNRHVQRSNTLQSAVAVGDGCIELLFAHWRATCSLPANVHTALATSAFSAIPTPAPGQLNLPSVTNFVRRGTSADPANDEYFSDYTISNYKLVAASPEWTALPPTGTPSPNASPVPMLGQIAGAVSSTAPTTPVVYNYVASADVTLPALGPTGKIVAKVRRVFQKQQLSPWNFAIFYVDPLEIHPGPQFTVTGWVHTNSDLYTGHDTLTFADKVTYGSDWFVGFKPGDTTHDFETPAAPHYLSNLPPARDQALQPFGLDATSIFSTTDPNPNNDSYRELIEQPVAGYTDPLAGQRYYDQAAIKIQVDTGTNNFTIKKLNGTTVTSSSSGIDKKLYNAVFNALTTTPQASIQDDREAAPIRLTTLDVGAIVTSLNAPSSGSNRIDSTLWNGIIYITDTSNSTSTRRGIRLIHGQVLPNNGITVASANPVYIQGDYNTGSTLSAVPGATPTVQPPSNYTSNNDPLTPQVSGYTRQPSSVAADAVTILSNSWVDSAAGTEPTASNTTVNTAIVAGIVPSAPVGGDGSYSGGAENFPRFLETWTDKTFTYYGSMVELYKSQQSVAEWTCCSVYYPPVRQWYFDNNFKISPPPGSIMLYSYIKGKWSVL